MMPRLKHDIELYDLEGHSIGRATPAPRVPRSCEPARDLA